MKYFRVLPLKFNGLSEKRVTNERDGSHKNDLYETDPIKGTFIGPFLTKCRTSDID